MRWAVYSVWFFGVTFLFCVSAASANTTNVSSDPVHAEQFTFFCGPYLRSFEEGKHYKPNTTTCTYSIPNTLSGHKIVALYQGTPGVSATLAGTDLYTGAATLIHQTPNTFGTPAQDAPFFAVVYDASLDSGSTPLNAYLSGATSTLPAAVVEGTNFYQIPWLWGAKGAGEFDPVIIIPGILGSWEKDGEWILDPITHIYDNLVDTLLANGYIENETLFKFPYDWRQSNVITAQLLNSKIQEIKDSCDCGYVDIIAHSMGGLVATQYVISDDYREDVDQIFYLGTPMAGAPDTYPIWEAGLIQFEGLVRNILMNRIFEREARDLHFESIFSYVRSGLVASVSELLPLYSYLSTATSTFAYPTNHPQNLFLENQRSNMDKLLNSVRPYTLIGNTGNASTTSGYSVKPSTVPPLWEHGEPVVTKVNRGDGTVPHFSSLFFIGPEKEYLNTDHLQLVTAGSGYVFESLNNSFPQELMSEPFDLFEMDFEILVQKIAPSSGDFRIMLETLVDILPFSQTTKTASKILLILLFSPIDVEVIAPDGNRIGKDVATGVILNEIPNALYSGADANHEFVLILDPLPGEYKLKTDGTDTGAYIIAAGYGDTATSSVSFVSGETIKDQVISNTLLLSPTSTSVTIIEDHAEPVEVSSQTCIADMQLAYANKWIKKKSVYNALVANCKLLGTLFTAREKAKSNIVLKGINLGIKATLDHMDRLANERGNTQEAKDLIAKNTTWFRENKL